jgi:uncharacterized membrane protein
MAYGCFGYGMMGGSYGYGWMLFSWLIGGLFIVAIVLSIFYFTRKIQNDNHRTERRQKNSK